MRRLVVTLVCLAVTVAVVSGARAVAAGSFRSAAAADLRDSSPVTRSSGPESVTFGQPSSTSDTLSTEISILAPAGGVPSPIAIVPDLDAASFLTGTELAAPRGAAAAVPVSASAPSSPTVGASSPVLASPVVAAAVVAAPTPVRTPVVAATPLPLPTPVPAQVVVATPVPAPIVAPAAPPSCAASWFCYPRLGIAGPIVPYSDCLGQTDIGEGIRSFTCISPFYIMGHAYTQFGAVTGWQAGDVVFASGRRFVISSAFVQNSCEPPAGIVAPLSLQTSLTSGGCGRVLVVQGR